MIQASFAHLCTEIVGDQGTKSGQQFCPKTALVVYFGSNPHCRSSILGASL